jgi:predicted double-glycine peptidase
MVKRDVAPLPANLLPVPSVKQKTTFSCGSAATLALLRYWQWDEYSCVEENDLRAALQTTEANGTEPEPIAAFLDHKAGITATYRHDDVSVHDLEVAVDAGFPPLVDLQAWRDVERPWKDVWDAGHYVVMVGYDRERLFFMDPGTLTPGSYAFLGRDELDERWHDLTGSEEHRVHRMAIFARGSTQPVALRVPIIEVATSLG